MRTIKWGLIGCGDISRKRVAPALRDALHSRLWAVTRADASRAEAFALEFGAQRWYADWRELVADPEIDAVYIATPVHLHATQTMVAAAHGKHVLCEKPMAMDVRECDGMIDACAANRVLLGIAYYRHFYPVLERIKTLLRQGAVGEVSLIQMHAYERYDGAPGAAQPWRLQKKQAGGGPMMDFGCHRIEVLLHLLGPIAATRSLLTNSAFHNRDVEDTAAALFRFASGALGMLSVTHATQSGRDSLEIIGSAGTLIVPVLNAGTLQICDAHGTRTEEHPPHSNIHQPLIEDFIRAVFEKSAPGVDGELGREVTRILDEIYGNPQPFAQHGQISCTI